ncbi:MAG TPA: NUDIX domain-containing protein [Chloroflexota bacterium]|nr:NUDIX domain-containing protein [Chloroflexota bacterium]
MFEQASLPRVAVSVDVVGFRLQSGEAGLELQVLLVRRLPPPFAWQWALPGGVLGADERLAACACRLLRERTGGAEFYLEQLYTFDALDRDPRGRTLSVAYYALLRGDAGEAPAERDAADARWWPVRRLPAGGMLAFDHAQVIRAAHERLRGKLDYAPLAFHLLPATFTMTQLRRVYEAIQERSYDPTNFPRAMLARFPGLAPVVGERDRTSKRPARVYRYEAPPA